VRLGWGEGQVFGFFAAGAFISKLICCFFSLHLPVSDFIFWVHKPVRAGWDDPPLFCSLASYLGGGFRL